MINDITLSVDVWDTIKDLLVGQCYVTNSTTGQTSTAAVGADYNDKKPNKPQIIIPNISLDEGDWKFGSRQGRKEITVNIDCYHNTSLGISQLKDQVSHILKEEDIDGLTLSGVQSSVGYTDFAALKFKVYNLTFTYLRE